jgi:hypothetical protein
MIVQGFPARRAFRMVDHVPLRTVSGPIGVASNSSVSFTMSLLRSKFGFAGQSTFHPVTRACRWRGPRPG